MGVSSARMFLSVLPPLQSRSPGLIFKSAPTGVRYWWMVWHTIVMFVAAKA